jgi:hypothetical protein
MFDLLDRPLVWIPVTWPALLSGENENDLAQPGEHTVELRVELVDAEEAIALFPPLFPQRDQEAAAKADDNPQLWAFKTFKRVVKEWRKISAGGKASPPMNDKNIRLLLKAPMFIAGFASAYMTALGGRAEVREKNSVGSPSDGRAETGSEAQTESNETANDGA